MTNHNLLLTPERVATLNRAAEIIEKSAEALLGYAEFAEAIDRRHDELAIAASLREMSGFYDTLIPTSTI